MSGHSKWATIKRKKGAADAKRGRVFTRLIKEITVAARDGGGDPETNPRLRTAVQNAKAQNMPNDNIEKAIKRGTGELPGVNYEEAYYEGYGPGGIALYIQTLTDNKNRTVAELRHLMDRNGAHMGESGSVAWMFDRKGIITVPSENADEDTLFEIALDAGAEDMKNEDGVFEITVEPSDFEAVKSALEENSITFDSAEISFIPQNLLALDADKSKKALKLLEALEDHDDVQSLATNFDMPEDLMEE